MTDLKMKLQENRCRQCKKLFCCLSCRLAHEHKKHLERHLKCPLCCSKKLQIRGDESHEFICHLIFNHLPLLCHLCGQMFKSSQDLALLRNCGWWRTDDSQRLLKILGKTLLSASPSLEIAKTSINSCSNKEVLSGSRRSADFVTFNSPPVLTRNTSTPMNIGLNGLKSKSELRSLNTFSFFVKTPEDFSSSLEGKGSEPIIDHSQIKRFSFDSQYYSGLLSQSRSSLQGSITSRKSDNPSVNSQDFYQSCESVNSDGSKKSVTSINVEESSELGDSNKKEIRESSKKVRFSDQFDNHLKMAEHEDFYEAHENMSVVSPKNTEEQKYFNPISSSPKKNPNVSINQENQMNIERENKISSKAENVTWRENPIHHTENDVDPRENFVSLDQSKVLLEQDEVYYENKENESPIKQSGSSDSRKSTSSVCMTQQPGSSRVLMMVLVENTTSRFSRSELAPLIDSGLKKLEETVSSTGSFYSPISSGSSQVERNSKTLKSRKRSITSVNTYLSVASTECFSAKSGSHFSQWSTSRESLPNETNDPPKSDGILSVVARVVRSALRKLPGASSFQGNPKQSLEPQPSAQHPHQPAATTSTSTLESLRSVYEPSFASESVSSQPSIKRPRDLTLSPTVSQNTFQYEDRSPIAKRPRGWYKIRAREPIARMRKMQVTSPRGVSSETQRFQQGSLSVGRNNTILPLPSRAHQCTQTEET